MTRRTGRRENGSNGIKVLFGTFLEGLVRQGAPLWYYKTHGSRFTRAGALDWLICIDGNMLAVETKREDLPPEPDPAQEREIVRLKRARALTLCTNRLEVAQAFVIEQLSVYGWERPAVTSARARQKKNTHAGVSGQHCA